MVKTASAVAPTASSSEPSAISVGYAGKTSGGYLFRITRLTQGNAIITTRIGNESASFTATAGPSVLSDTTVPFTLRDGAVYTFKMSVLSASSAAPKITVGNGGVLTSQFIRKSGSDFYYKVQAVVKVGDQTGVYTQMPSEKAVRQCIVTVAPVRDFTIDSSGVLLKYIGAGGVAVIPSGITAIGSKAFENTAVTGVVIPSTVTRIGEQAFDFSRLQSIVIPDSVTGIGDWAFAGCASLASVTFGSVLAKIGGNAFNGCTSLTEAVLPESVTSLGTGVFNGCKALTCVKLPSSLTEIPDFTFYGTGITGYTVPDGVIRIGTDAFVCGSLKEITLPDSLEEIGGSAFFDCASLKSVHIPDRLTEIQDCTFADCHFLSPVTFPESVTSIGEEAFNACSSFGIITIPKTVVHIADTAFLASFAFNPDPNEFSRGLFIQGYEGTAAQYYANNNKLPFVTLGVAGNPTKRFTLDTTGTFDFGDRSTYCYMVRTASPNEPLVRSSDPDVASVQFEKKVSGDYIFRINRLAQGTAAIATTVDYAESLAFLTKAGPSVRSDTTVPFSLRRGASYTFRVTVFSAGTAVPKFTVGDGNVFQTQYVKQSGNDYFFKIQAIGNSGEETAVYTKMPGESAVKQYAVKIS